MLKSIILYIIMLALTINPIKNKKKIINKIGFKKINAIKETKYALSTLLLLLITSAIISAIFLHFGFEKDAGITSKLIKQIPLWQVLIIIIIGSITEEIFFRGYIQRKTNLLTASFIFSYFHIIYGSITEVTGAFFLGLILGYAYEKRKNLYSPILAHFLYDIITITLIYLI